MKKISVALECMWEVDPAAFSWVWQNARTNFENDPELGVKGAFKLAFSNWEVEFESDTARWNYEQRYARDQMNSYNHAG